MTLVKFLVVDRTAILAKQTDFRGKLGHTETINVWNQFLSWNTTYFLTTFFVIFPHLNWLVDKIFFRKISLSHEYLKIYGGIHQGEINRGGLTGSNSPEGRLAGGNSPGVILRIPMQIGVMIKMFKKYAYVFQKLKKKQ